MAFELDRPIEQAGKFAVISSEAIDSLFDKLGTKEHPRGTILTAYRKARKALQGKLKDRRYGRDILQTLRQEVEQATRDIFQAAIDVGRVQATKELAFYNLPMPGWERGGVPVQQIDDKVASVLAAVDRQILSIWAAMTLSDVEQWVLGDGSRMGILQPAPISREINKWLDTLAVLAWEFMVMLALLLAGEVEEDPITKERRPIPGLPARYARMAICDFCPRVTDCCTKVHGQIVGLFEDFKLVGTPRWADRMRNPPFHWNCHTVVALVRVKEGT